MKIIFLCTPVFFIFFEPFLHLFLPWFMSRLLLLIFCFTLANDCVAQQNKRQLDSLQKELTLHSKPDSVRAALLVALSEPLTYSDPGTALQFAREGLQISNSVHWLKGQAIAYRAITNVYIALSDYKTASDNLYQGEAVAEKSGDQRLVYSMYTMRANIYAGMEQYDKALIFHKKYVEVTQRLGAKKEEVVALANMGGDYVNLKLPDSGLQVFNIALSKAREQKLTLYSSFLFFNIGEIYNGKEDYPEAIRYFTDAIQEAPDNISMKSSAENGLAVVYNKMNDLQKAKLYCMQALDDANKISAIDKQAQAYELLTGIYEKQHEDGKALAAYKTFINLRDSIMNTDKRQEIQRKEQQHDFDKKEAENGKKQALALAEIRRQKTVRNAAIAGIAILLVAGAASFNFYKRIRDADLKAQVTDTEMKALRAQMNPHFIFNSLNSINDYISRNETRPASEYLSKFAALMRMILENSEQKEVLLSEDLKALELYMQLEAGRMTHSFSYDINIDTGIDPEAVLIPPMILQPFVENSIWHGLSKKTSGGMLKISITRTGDMICCRVDDNGVGRRQTTDAGSGRKSLGMKITQSRIDVLNRQKNANAFITVTDLPEGTSAQITLPLSYNF